jgi:hypothetical protein
MASLTVQPVVVAAWKLETNLAFARILSGTALICEHCGLIQWFEMVEG